MASEAQIARKKCIFVIEDDRAMRELTRLHLAAEGHEVHAFADAVEGGHALLERSPDLVICDINMPYMSGLELITAMRGDPQTAAIPVIIMTAHTDDETWSKAFQLGIVDFITKPLIKDEMLAAVAKALKLPTAG